MLLDKHQARRHPKSCSLLGLAPYFDPGTRSPRNDVPSPEGGEIWDQMKEWHVDADFMWKKGARIRDFWILHSSM